MKIDDCKHDFQTLATTVLPEHMGRLESAMAIPMLMRDFAEPKVGVATLLKRRGLARDFSGCYVLIDSRPVYIGISRSVFDRLRQHVTGRTHYDASLAYRMAADELPHEKTRDDAMEDEVFATVFLAKRDYLRTLKVAAVEIDNAVELCLFEVFAAMAFGTSKWNTFRTH